MELAYGAALFGRQPFQLTAWGEKLYAYIRSFFQGVETIQPNLLGGLQAQVRIAAEELRLIHSGH